MVLDQTGFPTHVGEAGPRVTTWVASPSQHLRLPLSPARSLKLHEHPRTFRYGSADQRHARHGTILNSAVAGWPARRADRYHSALPHQTLLSPRPCLPAIRVWVSQYFPALMRRQWSLSIASADPAIRASTRSAARPESFAVRSGCRSDRPHQIQALVLVTSALSPASGVTGAAARRAEPGDQIFNGLLRSHPIQLPLNG
jgi:hypothetical protein